MVLFGIPGLKTVFIGWKCWRKMKQVEIIGGKRNWFKTHLQEGRVEVIMELALVITCGVDSQAECP
jgi:hypothetical protein